MITVISTGEAVAHSLERLERAFLKRFVFLQNIAGPEHAELFSSANLLKHSEAYRTGVEHWGILMRQPEFADTNMPVTLSFLRKELTETLEFEATLLRLLLDIEYSPEQHSYDDVQMYFSCFSAYTDLKEVYYDWAMLERGERSLFR